MPKIGQWKLPRPPQGEHTKWKPIVRVGTTVPFGYQQDPNDKDTLLPIPEELILLEQAKKHLKKYSLREVAEWLTRNSGRTITHAGLRHRIEIEHKRQNALSQAEYWRRRYEEAKKKTEKLEGKLGNNRT